MRSSTKIGHPITQIPLCDDSRIMDEWLAIFGAAALTVADEIGLFDCLAIEARALSDLARELKVGEPCLDCVCRVLIGEDLIVLEKGRILHLTEAARTYWVSTNPLYRGIEFERRREFLEHKRVLAALRESSDPSTEGKKSFTEMWSLGSITEEAAARFTRSMHAQIFAAAIAEVRSGALRSYEHIVDVGGGSGAFCAALLAEQPTSQATVMDLPQVCDEARKYVQQWGLQNDVKFYPANFFKDPWPQDADAFHFSNILHDWPVKTCQELIRRAYDNLKPGGHVLIHECLLNEGRTTPKTTVVFDLLMQINHRSQQFTFEELSHLLIQENFQEPRRVHTFGYYSLVVAKCR